MGATLALRPLSFARGRFEAVFETREQVYGQFGNLQSGIDTTPALKLYNAKSLEDKKVIIESLPNAFGISIHTFSFVHDPAKQIEVTIPDIKKSGYDSGNAWIYDPRIAYGSFKDSEYTWLWRLPHELGHAITEPFLLARYGGSRRNGRIGRSFNMKWKVPDKSNPGTVKERSVKHKPLSVRLAQRAVEWEDLAFRSQRFLLEECGVTIGDEDFGREYNVNISDAVYRVLTGEFGDPGGYGMKPYSDLADLKEILAIIDDAGEQVAQETGNSASWEDRIDLGRWLPISDKQIRAAIEKCRKVGLASLHKDRLSLSVFSIPTLFDPQVVQK